MKRPSSAAVLLALAPAVASAQNYPSGFRQTHVLTGLSAPTQARFAHDGRVYVAEKSGRIRVFANLLDTAPQPVADVGADVHDYHDRGLLGLALDPHFPERPYLYVLYTHNGGLFDDRPPRWPIANCPNPPGATSQGGGCVVSGRLDRLTIADGRVVATTILIEDWYQQFPSHSIGSVHFGADGYLYAGGGDGASYNWGDWGQHGNPAWPDRRSPANQGGALRAQGLEVAEAYTDRVWLNGTIVRIDPATGAAAPDNPLAPPRGADAQAARIVAYGLRNPFRFTIRPGTSEVWIGDVGANTWEEINVLPAVGPGAALRNFGWPCFEGRLHNTLYAARPICATLYGGNDSGGRTPVTAPWYTYAHSGSNAISGLAFYQGGGYPADYVGALFFADYNANRIRVIKDGDGDGLPDAPADGTAALFADGGSSLAVDLLTGPGGDLFFLNVGEGRLTRVSYDADPDQRNLAPAAAIALAAGQIYAGGPRTIGFSAANSVDLDAADTLAYAWDLDGDGAFDDATGIEASAAFQTPGEHRVTVRVEDGRGGSDLARMTIIVVDPLIFADGFDTPTR